MKPIFYLFILLLLLSSCATLTTRKTHHLRIKSNANDAKVEIKDSIYTLPATIYVEKSKENLSIKLITDSANINYTIKPSLNPAFLLGNLAWLQFSPIAYSVDFTNKKRFYYGNFAFIDISDTTRLIRTPVSQFYFDTFLKKYQKNKGEIYLHLSVPYINSFHLKPKNEGTKFNTGFWGLSTGLDYYYNQKRFVALSASIAIDLFVPIPAPVTIKGDHESLNTSFLALSNNHRVNRFTFGYGISFSNNYFAFRSSESDTLPPTRESFSLSHNLIGFIYTLYYELFENAYVGCIYKPSFFRPKMTNKFEYEHLISIDFAYKIRLRK